MHSIARQKSYGHVSRPDEIDYVKRRLDYKIIKVIWHSVQPPDTWTYRDIEGVDVFSPALSLTADHPRSFQQVQQIVAFIGLHWPANHCLHRRYVTRTKVCYLSRKITHFKRLKAQNTTNIWSYSWLDQVPFMEC